MTAKAFEQIDTKTIEAQFFHGRRGILIPDRLVSPPLNIDQDTKGHNVFKYRHQPPISIDQEIIGGNKRQLIDGCPPDPDIDSLFYFICRGSQRVDHFLYFRSKCRFRVQKRCIPPREVSNKKDGLHK